MASMNERISKVNFAFNNNPDCHQHQCWCWSGFLL